MNQGRKITMSPELILSGILGIGNLLLLMMNASSRSTTERLNTRLDDLRVKSDRLESENDELKREVTALRAQVTTLMNERLDLYKRIVVSDK